MRSNIVPFAFSLLATVSLAQTSPAYPDTAHSVNKSPSGSDASFMKTLAAGSIAEIEAGKLAKSKADNKDVKEFAEKMVKDHTKNSDQLKTLAKQKEVDLPTVTDAEHVAEKNKLEKLSGAAFDAEYIQGQVKDHQLTVQLLKQEIDSGQDAKVKAFAQETLTTVQHHLEMVQDLQGKVSHSSH